jgi:hypothetical protein
MSRRILVVEDQGVLGLTVLFTLLGRADQVIE